MTPTTQTIASLEQQLRELFGESTLPIRSYGAPPALPIQIDGPCITIVATSSRHMGIVFYLLYDDAEQIEHRVLAIAEKCITRWHQQPWIRLFGNSIGWYQQEGTIYRTFSFVLACE